MDTHNITHRTPKHKDFSSHFSSENADDPTANLTPGLLPIEIIRLTLAEPNEAQATGLIAHVDLRIGPLIVYGWRVRLARGAYAYVNPPAHKVGDKWLPWITVDDPALHAEIKRIVISAVTAAEATR